MEAGCAVHPSAPEVEKNIKVNFSKYNVLPSNYLRQCWYSLKAAEGVADFEL